MRLSSGNHQAELKSRTLPDWEAGLRADINRLREAGGNAGRPNLQPCYALLCPAMPCYALLTCSPLGMAWEMLGDFYRKPMTIIQHESIIESHQSLWGPVLSDVVTASHLCVGHHWHPGRAQGAVGESREGGRRATGDAEDTR